MQSLLLDFVVIFATSVVAAVLCHRLRLPSAIGLILGGVLIGPKALGLIQNDHEIELLAEIGVVLLLFVIGLEISIADLTRLKRFFVIGGSAQFFGTALLATMALLPLGFEPGACVYLGFVAALSSTAIVLRLLQDRGELETPQGRAILSILIYQDVGVVPVMLMAPLLANGASNGTAAMGLLVLKMALVVVLGFSAYRWIMPWFLERITRTRSSEAFLLGVFTLCIGIALLTQSLGLSLALGAFLAGFILSESEYSHQAVATMLPFRDVLMSLFFISIGMLLNLSALTNQPLQLLLLTLAVLLLKPLVATIGALLVGLPLRQSLFSGLALGQVGEFSLVATKAGVSAGLLGADVFQTILAITVLSMLATPALVGLAPALSQALSRTAPGRWLEELYQEPPSEQRSALEHHVLIVGFGVTGRNLARSCRFSGVPYAVVELNAALVKQARSQGEPIHFGDAAQASILALTQAQRARAIVVVIDDPGAARRIVELARRQAPDAFILVRSRYLREVEPLQALGADEVIADELEVSIEVFSRVLTRMLVPRETIQELSGEIRGEWRRMVRDLAPEATRLHDLQVVLPQLETHTLRLSPTSQLVGRSIATSRLREDHGVIVLAINRDGQTIPTPQGSLELLANDSLFVIGPQNWSPATI
ncbi:MAG: cation:proton antiporter [Vulcanococcus sp.]